jgi:hypothetical protein
MCDPRLAVGAKFDLRRLSLPHRVDNTVQLGNSDASRDVS